MSRAIVVLLVLALLMAVAAPVLAASVPIPSPWAHRNAQAVFANGKVYFPGGLTWDNAARTDAVGKVYQATPSANFDIYDPTANTWVHAKYDGTGPSGIDNDGDGVTECGEGMRGDHTQTFAYNDDADSTDEIFIKEGNPEGNHGFLRYDPDTDAWSEVDKWTAGWTGGGRYDQVSGYAIRVGTVVYCFAGQGDWGATGTDQSMGMAKYDFATSTWTELATTPANMAIGVGVAIGTDIYVTCGNAGTTIYKFDTTTETWSTVSVTMNASATFGTAVAYNGKMYVFGLGTADIQVFDPSVPNVTTYTGALPVALSRTGAAIDASTGVVYVGGGQQGGNYNDVCRPWWKGDLDDLPGAIAWTSLAANVTEFPYEDWVAAGSEVTGTVTLADGTPVPGAAVCVKPVPAAGTPYGGACADPTWRAITRVDGTYGPFVVGPEGDFYIAVWKEGWDPSADATITVNAAGDAISADLQLTQVAGKNVNVADTGRPVYAATNDSSGGGAADAFNEDEHPLRDYFGARTRGKGNRWSSTYTNPPNPTWLGIDLFNVDSPDVPTPLQVDGVDLLWDDGYAVSYSVEVTNGETGEGGLQADGSLFRGAESLFLDDVAAAYGVIWEKVYEVHGNVNFWQVDAPGGWPYWWCKWTPIRWSAKPVRAVRIVMTQPGWRGGYSIWDAQIHSADDYRDQVVCGLVKNAAGNPIPNTHIYLGGQFEQTQEVFTDAGGFYWIPARPGTHQFFADAVGYKNVDSVLNVVPSVTPMVTTITLPDRPGEGNLVQNGDFETAGVGAPTDIGAANWTFLEYYNHETETPLLTASWNNTWCHSGSGSALYAAITAGAGGNRRGDLVSSKFPVISDGSKAYSMTYHRTGGNGPAGPYTVHGIRWYGADGTTYLTDNYYYAGWGSDQVWDYAWWRDGCLSVDRVIPPAGAAYGEAFIGTLSMESNFGNQVIDDVVVDESDVTRYQDISTMNDGDYIALGSIGQVMALNQLETAAGGIPANTGFLELTNRTSAVRLDLTNWTGGDLWMGPGDKISKLVGYLKVAPSGERYIDVRIMNWSNDQRPLDALGMNSKAAASDEAKGLFVKLWGTVTSVGSDNFIITDGGTPIRVMCGTLNKPSVTNVVRVRGIISTDPTAVELLMRPEQVDWTTGDEEYQPLPFQGPVKAFRDYLFIGPFRTGDGTDQNAELAHDYISELTGGAVTEATIGLPANSPSVGDTLGSLAWVRHDGTDELVNLQHVLGNNDNCITYGFVYVWSPITQTVDLVLGSDDSLHTWFNGTKVLEDFSYRGISYGQNCIEDQTLNAGINTLLFKIYNGGGGYGVVTQIAVPDTYSGSGFNKCTPVEGLGYLLNRQP